MLTKLEANKHRWLFDPDLEEKYSEAEIWLKSVNISNYIINDDGIIDVDGNVDLIDMSDSTNKIPYKFGKVIGDFRCNFNGLISLEGAPESVSGKFICSDNNLTSLEGCPKHVGSHFNCVSNNLTSLIGAPESVGGKFICFNNLIKFTEEDVKAVCKVGGDIKC